MSERKARRRRPMRLSSERGDETETRKRPTGSDSEFNFWSERQREGPSANA